ncbi:hypothetical protein AaE_016157 [Aphanomyces astaci]|uniref:Uncharacterized protein n=1 Tax=Aphanomyces astaci TaxID=112090 RepID=A0A6A4YZE4_APHAT|nr:hypothetical protein AaE_016157 [Aphanomyces astaci]
MRTKAILTTDSMAFLAPQLTIEQTIALVATLVHRAKGRRWVLRRLLQVCVSEQLLRLRRPPGISTYTNQFNTTLEIPTAIELYRFTIEQPALLTAKLRLSYPLITPAGDNVRGTEALASCVATLQSRRSYTRLPTSSGVHKLPFVALCCVLRARFTRLTLTCCT